MAGGFREGTRRPFFVLSLHCRNGVHVRAQIGVGDQLARADGGAAAAGNTFVIVDDREIMHHMDGVVVALPFAEVTADAAHVADLSGDGATLMVGAGDDDVGVVGDGYDDLPRAGLHALHAASTLVRVHAGDAVDHMDGVKFTDGDAGAEAETAGGAGVGAVARDKDGGAASREKRKREGYF